MKKTLDKKRLRKEVKLFVISLTYAINVCMLLTVAINEDKGVSRFLIVLSACIIAALGVVICVRVIKELNKLK